MATKEFKTIIAGNDTLKQAKTNVIRLVGTDEYFIHIPKCGGTAVRDKLITLSNDSIQKLEIVPAHNHSKISDLKDIIPIRRSKFLVSVRNPIGRFHSAYNFLKDIDYRELRKVNPISDRHRLLLDRRNKMKSMGIEEFVKLLESENSKKKFREEWYSDEPLPNHFEWAFELQSEWIKGSKKINYFQIETQQIFEYLDTDFTYSKVKHYDRELSLRSRDIIHNYFIEDFRNFGYDFSDKYKQIVKLAELNSTITEA